MLALVAAIEAGVARDVLDFSDPVSLSWRLAAQAARDESAGRSVLCVGDSLVKHGMIPKVIAAPIGPRRGQPGGGPRPRPGHLLPVPPGPRGRRPAVGRGGRLQAQRPDRRPAFQPPLLAGVPHPPRGPGAGPVRPQWLPVLRDGGGVAAPLVPLAARDPRQPAGGLRGETDALRGSIAPASGTGRSTTAPTSRPRTPPSTAWSGPTRQEAPDPRLPLPPRQRRVYPPHLRAGRRAASGSTGSCRRCRPSSRPVASDRAPRRATSGSSGRCRRVIPDVTVVDGRHAGYDHTLFVDASHLDGQGAYTLSRDVADVLRRDRDAGRRGRGVALGRPPRLPPLPRRGGPGGCRTIAADARRDALRRAPTPEAPAWGLPPRCDVGYPPTPSATGSSRRPGAGVSDEPTRRSRRLRDQPRVRPPEPHGGGDQPDAGRRSRSRSGATRTCSTTGASGSGGRRRSRRTSRTSGP